MKVDFSRFEPLAGSRPALVVARHPAGDLLALQTLSEAADVAPALGIWEEATGALVWTYEGVAGLVWTADGAQLLLWKLPTADAALDVRTPGRFERRSWPADAPLSACAFALPWTPWPRDLWVAPDGALAAVRWVDEGLSGWEPVILSPMGDAHLAGAGFMLDSEVATDTHPVLSPSGHYAVSGYQTVHVTSREGFLVPRQQGRFEVGRVVVMDLRAHTFRDILLDDAVPAKLHGTAARWSELPAFLDETRFSLTLPTGATRVFTTLE
jgi:hypothetical protein